MVAAKALSPVATLEGFGVAIDPGVRGCGVAVFHDGEFVHAQYTGCFGGQVHPLLEPGARLLSEVSGIFDLGVSELVIEKPKVYDTRHQKGDQRDLVNLAIVVGGIMEAASPFVGSILLVEPWQWKGQTPKEISNERTKAALTKAELEGVSLPKAKSLHHNVWDAIGIGLYRWRG